MKLSPRQQQLQEQLGLIHWRLRDAQELPEDATVTLQHSSSSAESPDEAEEKNQAEARPVSVPACAEDRPAADEHVVDVAQGRAVVPMADVPVAEAEDDRLEAPAQERTQQQTNQRQPEPSSQPCRFIWGGAEDGPRQRLQADLVRLLEAHGIAWQGYQEQPGLALPPAPTLCFVLQGGKTHVDAEGRLLLPQQPGAQPALAWKPQLWAYLQSILDRADGSAQDQTEG